MKKYGKFAALIAVILGTLVWLATAGSGESKTYYKTITEVRQMGVDSGKRRVRVIGDVEKDSIKRKAGEVAFVLVGENQKLKVIYTGNEPLPDTFRDGAQALAEGKMGPDGAFHAAKIQAKCASKYAAKPGETYRPQEKPAGEPQKISYSTQGM
jgi:cytochrome c-type biogenesis protein CcmE